MAKTIQTVAFNRLLMILSCFQPVVGKSIYIGSKLPVTGRQKSIMLIKQRQGRLAFGHISSTVHQAAEASFYAPAVLVVEQPVLRTHMGKQLLKAFRILRNIRF